MLEAMLVHHGAPTLAGIKTGSLFSMEADDVAEMEQAVEQANETLMPKGARLIVMKYMGHRALLYLYREALLAQCLACPKAQEILRECGYEGLSVDEALATLRDRLQEQDFFPHEIGLFLGYPEGDVAGFIRHQGQNCLLCGCWKVYGGEAEALRTFARYRKCTELYTKRFHTGCSLTNLTVAARAAG